MSHADPVEPAPRQTPTTPDKVDLKFTASESGPIQVSFEPIGTFFVLEPDESIYLRTPIGTLDSLQVVWWTGGIEVWVDHPGDHTVLDENGTELDTL